LHLLSVEDLLALRDEYNVQGYLRLPRLLSETEEGGLRQALGSWVPKDSEKTDFGFLAHNIADRLEPFHTALHRGAIGALAAQLMGAEEAVLFQELIVWKHPMTTRQVEWHQDYSYWPLDRPRGITIWLALDPADEENGCIRYISGSHRWGECRPTVYTLDSAYGQEGELPPLRIEEESATADSVSCSAGHAIAHHPLVCHMSRTNRSERHRRAWSLTWLDPSTRWQPSHAPHPFNHQLDPEEGTPVIGGRFPRFRSGLDG
jgi:ectoine hydroxylase-related dioxygenase (phytanoyl-CoA dioxygenase family)